MGVEEIIARINADADAEAARIRQVAADEAARIQREGETAAEAAYTTITADGRREAAARQRRIIARAQLAARGNVRKTREEGITRCFAGAKEHLSLLPPHLPIYPDVLRHLITEGQEVIGRERTRCSSGRRIRMPQKRHSRHSRMSPPPAA